MSPQFYTVKTKELYFRSKDGSESLPSKFGLQNNETEKITNHRPLFFRFSFLVFDFIANNFINVTLFYFIVDVSQSSKYMLLFMTANISWMIAAYINAIYFVVETLFRRTLQAFLLYTALLLLFIFLYKYSYSRLFVSLSFSAFAISLVVSRTIFIGTRHFLKSIIVTKKIVILGTNKLSKRLATNLTLPDSSNELVGFFDDEPQRNLGTYAYLGSINECLPYALLNKIDEIYSTIPPEADPTIYEIAQIAEQNFIRFKFVPDFKTFIKKRVFINFERDLLVFSLRSEPLECIENRFKKRVFDVVFSSLVIVLILSWLIPIIAMLIKLESKGPVFFKQLRSGKNNVPFLCFKFRSLHVNANADNVQVTRNDQRFTRIGKFLRKTNIDELPQFFNVLQGYMSIVGPRPHMLKHTRQYSEIINQYMVRHFVKPGITGWAQINGYRGEIKKEEQLQKRVECDINYMENWSMWLDMRIIALTVYKTLVGDKNAF
jgi:putative colanic acid biosysnthesis UDP-glucose lipid carrier transferase